jgi:magnesium transporter
VIADVAVYRDGDRVPCGRDLRAALAHWADNEGCFIWIGFVEPTAQELEPVAATLGLHPLAAEDAVHGRQRPKLERFGDELVMVSKTVRYVDHDEVIEVGDLLVFLGCRFVVTVRHGSGIDIPSLRKEMERDPLRLKSGPGEVLYALLDRIVDDYASALAAMEEDIDEVQDRVFSTAGQEHSQRIFMLKREVLSFRQAVVPLREPVAELAVRELAAVPEAMRPYFRDVEDHLLRMTDQLMATDAVLSSALDANIALIGIRQNEDMRKMSAWLAIGAVPTVIGAIYGMNFANMPELRWELGYPSALALMALSCVALYRNFKRRGWL